jgi:hypothetical protein
VTRVRTSEASCLKRVQEKEFTCSRDLARTILKGCSVVTHTYRSGVSRVVVLEIDGAVLTTQDRIGASVERKLKVPPVFSAQRTRRILRR